MRKLNFSNRDKSKSPTLSNHVEKQKMNSPSKIFIENTPEYDNLTNQNEDENPVL